MKKILVLMLVISSYLLASNDQVDTKKKSRAEKQIKKEMEKEKKYAREQTFYQSNNYDLKASEVNQDSVDALPNIKVDDLDMDSVYD